LRKRHRLFGKLQPDSVMVAHLLNRAIIYLTRPRFSAIFKSWRTL
jgi:hypothetical protein